MIRPGKMYLMLLVLHSILAITALFLYFNTVSTLIFFMLVFLGSATTIVAIMFVYTDIDFPLNFDKTELVNSGVVDQKGLLLTHLKQAESTIFPSVLDSLPELIWVTDIDNKFIWFNRSWLEFTGVTLDKQIGDGYLGLIHDADRDRFTSSFSDAFTGKTRFEHEFRLQHADEHYKWMYVTGLPLFLGKDVFVGFIGTCIDITDRKTAEENVRHSEEQVRAIMDSNAQGIFGTDREGNCTFINQKALSLLGYESSTELIGRNMHVAVHHTRTDGSAYPHEECVVRRAYLNNQSLYVDDEVYWKKNDTSFPVEYWGSPLNIKNETVGMVISFTDMTSMMHAREMQQKSDVKFERIFHSGPNAIDLVNLKTGSFLDVNTGFETIFRYSRDEVIGKSADELNLWVENDERDRFREMIREHHRVETQEMKLRASTGEIITGLVSAESVNIGDDECLITSVIDISGRKRAEMELMESQKKLRSLAIAMTEAEEKERRRIATNLHDHIAQNLSMMKLNISRIMDYELSSDVFSLLSSTKNVLEETIESSRRLVQDLSPTILYELGLGSAVKWLADKLQEKYQASFTVHVAENILPLERELQVILFKSANELMTNVCKHAQTDSAAVTVSKTGDQIELVVEDNGVGLAQTESPEPAGGFGLFNIRESISRFNGTLELSESASGGTRARITVPLGMYLNAEQRGSGKPVTVAGATK